MSDQLRVYVSCLLVSTRNVLAGCGNLCEHALGAKP